MVAITGDPQCPTVLDRRRISLADPAFAGSKQPYHAVEGLALSQAESLIDRYRKSTFGLAESALASTLHELKNLGANVVGCGLMMSSGRKVDELATILASHAQIHSAEGDFYRNAITYAAEKLGLPVTGLREKETHDRAIIMLNTTMDALLQKLGAMGKAIGSPWTQDEKLATLAAWIVLASSFTQTSVLGNAALKTAS